MRVVHVGMLLATLALAACMGNQASTSDNSATLEISRVATNQSDPGQTVVVHCANIIDYQSRLAHVSGIDIPIKAVGTTIKLGAVDLDPVTLRQASDLIQALDSSQVMYCKGLILVAPQDRYKVLQDYSTQVTALVTLLKNLSLATSRSDAQAAIATAASLARTSTSAAVIPPAPAASPSPPTTAAAAIPAAVPVSAAMAAAPASPAAVAGGAPTPTPTSSTVASDIARAAQTVAAAANAAAPKASPASLVR